MSLGFRPWFDSEKKWIIIKELRENEKWPFDYGQPIGMIVDNAWFPAVRQGHYFYMGTYNFPIRLHFIDSPFAPEGKEKEWHGWNLPEWIKCAKELEGRGVRAILSYCGLSGSIQRELSDSVNIPVFTSTILFVPIISRTLKKGKKVGIVTAKADSCTRWDNLLLKECGVDESIPIVIAGMTESEYCDVWWSQTNDLNYNPKEVEQAIVNISKKMVSEYPEIGAIVCECTEMPPYSDAIRRATGLPVFDSVDMAYWVYNMVKSQR